MVVVGVLGVETVAALPLISFILYRLSPPSDRPALQSDLFSLYLESGLFSPEYSSAAAVVHRLRHPINQSLCLPLSHVSSYQLTTSLLPAHKWLHSSNLAD